MGKLQKTVEGLYFTEDRLIEIAQQVKTTDGKVSEIESILTNLGKLSDCLETTCLELNRVVEEWDIEAVEFYEENLKQVLGNLPEGIEQLKKSYKVGKTKDTSKELLKSLNLV